MPPSSHVTSAHIDPPRRRRGRQARPSQLSHKMRRACRRFADAVGPPQVVEPAGFRDFRGWLAILNSRGCKHVWDDLFNSLAKEVTDMDLLHAVKEDVVREIIKCVVVPRPDESAKLVSTNAGRQANRPRNGTTLMVVLENQLERWERRLTEKDNRLPGVKDILGAGGRSAGGLPSFRELDESIQQVRKR